MFKNIVKVLLGIFVGGFIFSLSNFALKWVGQLIAPPPPVLDLGDAIDRAIYIADYPLGGVLILVATFGACFLTAYLASLLGRPKLLLTGIIVGALLFIFKLVDVFNVEPPVWFGILDVILCVGGVKLGLYLAMGPAKAHALFKTLFKRTS